MLEKEYFLTVLPETDEILRQFLTDSATLRYEDSVYLVYELQKPGS